jgi:Uma2 family endonuclease
MPSEDKISTAEQLLAARNLGRCELVRGQLVLMPYVGVEHGCIAARIGAVLFEFVERHSLGVTVAGGTGFQIAHDPDTVRAPDVAFVRADRATAAPLRGFFQGPPDLAVEVLSPDDRAGEVLAKVKDWLDAGCRRVWVADPRTRTVTIYRNLSEATILSESDTLRDDDLLPGFQLPVADVFRR